MKVYEAEPGKLWQKLGESEPLGETLYLPDGVEIAGFAQVEIAEQGAA